MWPSATRRRRVHLFGNGFVRLAVAAVFAAAVWSSSLVAVETRIMTAARWVADHSGATRASEVWRASGRPKVEHAATMAYQTLRQSATTVLDYLDVSMPANRTVEGLEKAVQPVAVKSEPGKDDKRAAQSGSATEKTR
jgi:hypothetical protein